mgnify:CR=1 FL=1
MKRSESILIVDDERIVRESLYHWFEDDGYFVDTADSAEDALTKFEIGKYDLFLIDMKMPGMDGLELLQKIKEADPGAIVVLITAFASVPSAIQALKDGAYDYVTKPVDPDDLANIVKKAIDQKNLKTENEKLKFNIEEIIRPNNLVGESRQMQKIFELIQTVAGTDTTVIIKGESGTGKELVAKAIHINSKRKYFPIIPVNCSSADDTALCKELFGHEKGAFEGADYKLKGKLEMADGGTLFLDEIGSISLEMQDKLLHVFDSKQFVPLGGSSTVKSDFRIITATNTSLEELVEDDMFSRKFYERLNVFTIEIPPLRDRREDIPLLAYSFLGRLCIAMNKNIKNISAEAMDFLMKYDWPGNVRELENAVERAVVIGKGDTIKVSDLPFRLSAGIEDDDLNDNSLSSVEKRHIAKLLFENNWNISKTAEILQIDRVTLYNKIHKYGLQRGV